MRDGLQQHHHQQDSSTIQHQLPSHQEARPWPHAATSASSEEQTQSNSLPASASPSAHVGPRSGSNSSPALSSAASINSRGANKSDPHNNGARAALTNEIRNEFFRLYGECGPSRLSAAFLGMGAYRARRKRRLPDTRPVPAQHPPPQGQRPALRGPRRLEGLLEADRREQERDPSARARRQDQGCPRACKST